MDGIAKSDDDGLETISLVTFNKGLELSNIVLELPHAVLKRDLRLLNILGFVKCR